MPIRAIAEVIGRHLLSGGRRGSQGRGGALQLAGCLPGARQPGLQRADPRADRMAAHPTPGLIEDLEKGHYFTKA